MYFSLSTALNYLLFDFVRCAFDPVLQEWVNKQTNKQIDLPELFKCVPLCTKTRPVMICYHSPSPPPSPPFSISTVPGFI